MIKFKKVNIGSEDFPINAYEASFEGYTRGINFSKVRICKDTLDTGWSIRVNVAPCKLAVVEYEIETLKEAKAHAAMWEQGE